jgi:hypothetical protein
MDCDSVEKQQSTTMLSKNKSKWAWEEVLPYVSVPNVTKDRLSCKYGMLTPLQWNFY